MKRTLNLKLLPEIGMFSLLHLHDIFIFVLQSICIYISNDIYSQFVYPRITFFRNALWIKKHSTDREFNVKYIADIFLIRVCLRQYFRRSNNFQQMIKYNLVKIHS